MTWWRVVLGLVLLLLVFLLSGAVSDSFASRGHCKTAKALMISPEWMERYRPLDKRFIDAGALYQKGDYEGAMEALDSLEVLRLADSSDHARDADRNSSAVSALRSAAALGLAEERLQEGRSGEAEELLAQIDPSLLDESQLARLEALRATPGSPEL